MTGLRIECYLPLSDCPVGIEGSPSVGWFAGDGGTSTGSHAGSVNLPRPATATPRRGGVNRWILTKSPASTEVSVRTR
jgi:hypothetical protein